MTSLRRVDAEWYDYEEFVRIPVKNVVSFSVGLLQADARKKMRAEIKARKKGECK